MESMILLWATAAWACPAELADPTAVASGESVRMTPDQAVHSARPGKLVGASCLASTGLMARRVMEEGAPWRWQGTLNPMEGNLESGASCPYTADQGTFNLLATGLLETIVLCGYATQPLDLEGQLLEVDGVRYVVLTAFRVPPK